MRSAWRREVETATHVDVIGRQEELEAPDGFLESLGAGPAALVLFGDAGVGKTTLWRAGADAARSLGYRVLETRPAAAEARLAFVGLGDLLGEGLDELLGALPPRRMRPPALSRRPRVERLRARWLPRRRFT